MRLLDIAIAQPSFRNFLDSQGMQPTIHHKTLSNITCGHEKRLAVWKPFQNPGELNFNLRLRKKPHGKSLIKAAVTLEATCPVRSEVGQKGLGNLLLSADSVLQKIDIESSSEDSKEVDEKEQLRRMRISKANKGNTPWNKGRKHSAETLQRIKERTRLAMQNPKVKMKLVKLGHAQSKETRMKIGVGVRMGWQRRRERLMFQETCFFQWQNLIAEAARKGFVGEEELQWHSYSILSKQLVQEWVESVEQRKTMPRPKGNSKRAPKSLEQRRKIAEAIAAKWADPEYRERVCAGLSKYHGTPAERKARRRPSCGAHSERAFQKKVDAAEKSVGSMTKMGNKQPWLKKHNAYKDPLASSKLEMIKNIRAQRAALEIKKNEALERAKLLIVEAEKAAKALEAAAAKSPIARSSLMESRKLIAEAIQSIQSIENVRLASDNNGISANEQKSSLGKEMETSTHDSGQAHQGQVNGIPALESIDSKHTHFDLYKLSMDDSIDDRNDNLQTSFSRYELPTTYQKNPQFSLDSLISKSELRQLLDQSEPNGTMKCNGMPLPNGAKLQTGMGKYLLQQPLLRNGFGDG
ncbi:hypothetical protein Nepgr_005687 [Nepenthes gracilis]|uniref:Nuclease associated modular domain-containing protein n=1 Tax=Nepenthes gracilis TaxID=150966 RepID=A0AAD3S3N5_NEPGR|nr:hypothetical protein Nepgr_005687 [Nepenthes gracilis]